MSTRLKQSLGAVGFITGLGALLVVLGVLQFRWTNQIRIAEVQRKQAALESGVNGFREDFHRELAGVCSNFGFPSQDETPTIEDIYAQQCGEWARTADHHELVDNYYLWEREQGGTFKFLQFGPQEEDFHAVACPARLGKLCDSANIDSIVTSRSGEFGPGGLRWRVAGSSLAMYRLVMQPGWRGHRSRHQPLSDSAPAGLMIAELNRDVFLKRFLPELALRYFAGQQGLLFDVAIVDGATPPQVIYSSEAQLPSTLIASPDESVHLFSSRRWRGTDGHPPSPGEPGSPPMRGRMMPGPGFGPPGRSRGFLGPLVVPDASAAGWKLLVRHPGGTLAEAAAGYWHRDLFLGLGVLLVLAASMTLVLVWTLRIRRLARMQMDFVTGVSHELRTPVSVISSAAENLADGVVDGKPQVKQYGTMIRGEAQRLAALIEQVLLFAATRNGKASYEARAVPVSETIDSAVADLSHLASANGFTVEKEVAPDLPPVMADPKALGRCLQNLMTNALKYGAGGRWMAVRAQPGSGPESGEVLITVQDRGQGIDPEELPHIFEPFYRGNAARASQAHGTGLGLSLAKEAAEAMGGKLTVASQVGEGSAFTLHFPAAKPA